MTSLPPLGRGTALMAHYRQHRIFDPRNPMRNGLARSLTHQTREHADRVIAEMLSSPTYLLDKQLPGYLSMVSHFWRPTVLLAAWRSGSITRRTLSAHLADTWSRCTWPHDSLTDDEWRELFSANGPVTAPDHIELFRGSLPEHRFKFSWTPDPLFANSFLGKWSTSQGVYGPTSDAVGPVLWTARVPGDAILAIIQTPRSGLEYVTDTRGLEVRPATRQDIERYEERHP